MAIVTCGSKGIGAAISRWLAKDGFTVVVNYAGDDGTACKTVGDIERAGGRADVSDAAVKAMFDEAERHGTLAPLVNNTGVMKLAPIVEADEALFDHHGSINLKGVFLGLQEAGWRMGPGGKVVHLSTNVVGVYQPTYSVYAATKAAVEAMTHIAVKQLGPKGINVNAVAPGPVATSLFLTGKSDELVAQITKAIPLVRIA